MESAAAAGRSSLTALSHRLLKQFSAGGKGVSNLVFSPLSVYSALSVLAAGARGGTLNELSARCRKGLVENASEMVHRALAGGPRMVYACGMWHDAMRNLKPVYRGVAARFMGVHAPRRAVALLAGVWMHGRDSRIHSAYIISPGFVHVNVC
jgi:serpin B